MPIERQSEQFGIFEDLPMPERTASVPDPNDLGDLLAGPSITAGLLNPRAAWREGDPWTYAPENAVPDDDEETWEESDEEDFPFGDPERWIPEELVVGRRVANPMASPGEGGSDFNTMFAPTEQQGGRLYTGIPGAAAAFADQVNLDPALRGDGTTDATAWNPGPKTTAQINAARRLLADVPPAAAPQQAQPQQQAQPELPVHLWDADAQQPACGVDQPLNVSSNDYQVTCPECQMAMQRKQEELAQEQQQQLMQPPAGQVVGRRISFRFADDHQPVDTHELLEDTVVDTEDRIEPDPDGDPPHLEMLRAQEARRTAMPVPRGTDPDFTPHVEGGEHGDIYLGDGDWQSDYGVEPTAEDRARWLDLTRQRDERIQQYIENTGLDPYVPEWQAREEKAERERRSRESAVKYSGPACECGCPINRHLGGKGLACQCGHCDALTVRV